MRACPRLKDILQNNWPGFFKKKKKKKGKVMKNKERLRNCSKLKEIKEA